VGVAMPPLQRGKNMNKIVRINTTFLVEVDDKDLKNIDKYTLDNFILNDLREKRKLVVEGKSTIRKSSEAVWRAEEKKQFS
tara:strand:- start:94 stop:336 length:243 start_codon:yes stop_codon:yes gene_type:complete